MFFWQAAEEAEDLHAYPRRRDLLHAPEQGGAALHRIEVDTLVGMAFSNLVALAIMVTTAAVLHPRGITDIQTSAQAAEALRPLAGPFSATVFALGIVGRSGRPESNRRGVGLGGQRQRVNIARALMNDPQLLLVDEPTAALDQERSRAIMELLANLTHEFRLASLVVTHDTEFVPLADRCVTMEDGRLQ